MTQATEESLPLLLGIERLESLAAITDIVGDIVVGPQTIGGYNTAVDELSHCLMILVVSQVVVLHQFVLGNRFTEFKVYPTLALQQTCENAVQILARLLDILRILRLVEFDGFEDVARLPLITHGHRHDVQFREGLYLVVRTAHAEHLDDTLVCGVDTVFGASVALGYPHALVLLQNGIADILGEVE